MIEFIKHYFSTPYIELIPGAILVLSLIMLAVGCLAVATKNRRKRENFQKNKQKNKEENKDGRKG